MGVFITICARMANCSFGKKRCRPAYVSGSGRKPAICSFAAAFCGFGKQRYLLAVDLGTDTIYVYNPEFTLLDTVSGLPENCIKENTAAAIRVEGNRVFVSNRGWDNIAIFTHQEGVLSPPVFVDAEGVSPRDFYVHGDLLLCANEGSDCVSVFDCQNGQMHSQKMHLQIPKPLCIVVKSEE